MVSNYRAETKTRIRLGACVVGYFNLSVSRIEHSSLSQSQIDATVTNRMKMPAIVIPTDSMVVESQTIDTKLLNYVLSNKSKRPTRLFIAWCQTIRQRVQGFSLW
jgi:hypothetical protein